MCPDGNGCFPVKGVCLFENECVLVGRVYPCGIDAGRMRTCGSGGGSKDLLEKAYPRERGRVFAG